MTHTIIVDEQYRAFERENTFNACVRHCKIGKVTRKVKPVPTWHDIMRLVNAVRPSDPPEPKRRYLKGYEPLIVPLHGSAL